MKTLGSYLQGTWQIGPGNEQTLYDATTEEPLASASTEGFDFKAALRFGREVGGPALRALGFAERGEILAKLAETIGEHRDELLNLGITNAGNTRSDAKFDVDGARATIFHYAELCKTLGKARYFVDGGPVALGRTSRLSGQHFYFPRRGVAVHINAFNFPAWGMAEKAATSIAAGVPFLVKPGTATALLAHRMFELFVESGAVPKGVAQLVVGRVGDLLDHLETQDLIAFTGSASTAAHLRNHRRVLETAIPFNVEADSLNVALLGPDVEAGTPTHDLFAACVTRDMTQKAGQKCTAARRVFVPKNRLQETLDILLDRLSQHKLGSPQLEDVTVGPLATAQQRTDVLWGIEQLGQEAEVICGGVQRPKLLGVDDHRGYFVAPTLLVARQEQNLCRVHTLEVFGPVATVIPYESEAQLFSQIERGGGSLVASVFSDDRVFVGSCIEQLSPYHGRLCVGSEKVASVFVPPGTVMPQLIHGGPGRAGGGTVLGGVRGMQFYMQRTAIQSFVGHLEELSTGATQP